MRLNQSRREGPIDTSARIMPKYLLVLFISLLVGVSYGFAYGDLSNQQVYLIAGLKLVDAEFLAADWWASNTTHYHHGFAYLVAFFESLGILPWALAITNLLVIAFSCLTYFVIIKAVAGRRTLLVWLIMVLVFFIFLKTESVAASKLFSPSLQPSSLAAFAFLLAIATFIFGRYGLSGFCFAFSRSSWRSWRSASAAPSATRDSCATSRRWPSRRPMSRCPKS